MAAKYRPNKIDGANPPPRPDVSLLANPQNASTDGGNFMYRAPENAVYKYFDGSNMGALAKPRNFWFGDAALFTALRTTVPETTWMSFSAAVGHTSLFRREDLPDNALCVFSVKIGTDTRSLSTIPFYARDFKELPNIPAANTGVVDRQSYKT